MSKYFIQDGMISRFDFMDNQEFYPLTTLCNMLNKKDEEYDILAKKFVIVSNALELLKDKNNYYCLVNENTETVDIDLALLKAKEMMESE